MYRRQWSRPFPRERDAKRQNGCLRRPYRELRKEEKLGAKEKRKDIPICDPMGSQVSLSPSHVQPFATLWTVALQAPLSMWILQAGILECAAVSSSTGLKLIFIESLVPSSYLILCHPLSLLPCLQSFPASESFPVSWLSASGGQSMGASASGSVLPMNIQP